jgi:hypothetical protein
MIFVLMVERNLGRLLLLLRRKLALQLIMYELIYMIRNICFDQCVGKYK